MENNIRNTLTWLYNIYQYKIHEQKQIQVMENVIREVEVITDVCGKKEASYDQIIQFRILIPGEYTIRFIGKTEEPSMPVVFKDQYYDLFKTNWKLYLEQHE